MNGLKTFKGSSYDGGPLGLTLNVRPPDTGPFVTVNGFNNV